MARNSDTLINVDGVSKKFCRSLKSSLWYGVKDVGRELFNRQGPTNQLRKNEFWAVNDVSFHLKRGECLGLIGPNGAGKSTLLKMLNGLVKPDRGRIVMKGRVGALIELGAGFNPILTARENIYINGSVLGLTKKEIDKRFDQIVDFAEIQDFIDTPVQSFSSGMKVRLGFAVAAQMEPDVLLIDEVLAVGDAGFRAKCYEAIDKISQNTAIILVSHTMSVISRVCAETVLITGGGIHFRGSSAEAIQKYFQIFPQVSGRLMSRSDEIEISDIQISHGQRLVSGDSIKFSIHTKCIKDYKNLNFSIVFLSEDLTPVCQISSLISNCKIDLSEGEHIIDVVVPSLQLNQGRYGLSLTIENASTLKTLFWHHNFEFIFISGDYHGSAPYQLSAQWLLK